MSSELKGITVQDGSYPLLIFDLVRAHEWFMESVRLSSLKFGVPAFSTAQTMLLGYIAQGERRPARLARAIGMSRQAVSALVAELVRDGVLKTETDPTDARAVCVDFTPEHLPNRDAVELILHELERRIGQIIGEDRLAVLRHSLSMDWGAPLQLDAAALGLDSSTQRSRTRRARK